MLQPGPCGWWVLVVPDAPEPLSHSYSVGATTIQNIINQISHHISYNGQAETTNVTSEESIVLVGSWLLLWNGYLEYFLQLTSSALADLQLKLKQEQELL